MYIFCVIKILQLHKSDNNNDIESPYDIMHQCETNIDTLDCKGLLECDKNCLKMGATMQNDCHMKFTNFIIARCDLHNAG